MTPSGKSRRFSAPSLPIPDLDLDRGHRRLFVDMTPESGVEPKRGDIMASVGKRGLGTCYLVLTAYQVKRKDPSAPPRYQMGVRIIPYPSGLSMEVEPHPTDRSVFCSMKSNRRVIEFHWYPRRKRTFEDLMRPKEET